MEHLKDFLTATAVVVGLASAPPGEAASSGDGISKPLLVQIAVWAMLLGWVTTGIIGKAWYDQSQRNQVAIIEKLNKFEEKMIKMSEEHEVVKANQARVLDEVRCLHQADADIWKAIREGVRVEKENRK